MGKRPSINTIKYLACSYFLLLGLATLALTASATGLYYKRDLAILLFLGLPIIINKRIFHLAYGLLSSIVTLALLFVYVFSNNPWRADISLGMFAAGLVVFSLSLAASLALVYVGTYSRDKNTFRLI